VAGAASQLEWLEPVVEPSDVADAILACVARPKSRVAVPRPLGRLVRAGSLLPTGLWRRAEYLVGLDGAFTHADAAARERYHRRLTGG
jgi:hypothetical protein